MEVLRGEISLRRFRLMVEHLPPGNPFELALAGSRWGDLMFLLWDTNSQLRDLGTMYVNAHRKGSPIEPTYLDRPKSAAEVADEATQAAMDQEAQDELEELW